MAQEYEVSISCNNLADKDLLSRSDPMVILLVNVPNTKRFVELGRTELIRNCLNPRFLRTLRITQGTGGEDPTMRVAVIDIDNFDDIDRLADQDFIGRAEFHQSLLTSNRTFSVLLSGNSGEVVFKTRPYDAGLDGHVTLELANHSFPIKDRAIFLEIYRLDEIDEDADGVLAYRSEQSVSGEFEPVKVSLFTLALGSRQSKLRFECWRFCNRGDHVCLGRKLTSLEELEQLYVHHNVPLLSFNYKNEDSRYCSLLVKYVDVRQ